MLGITISLAVVRIGLASHLISVPVPSTLVITTVITDGSASRSRGSTDPELLGYQILSELETFFTALVATLPALRALVRVKGLQPVILDKSLVCRGDEENSGMIVERYEIQEG